MAVTRKLSTFRISYRSSRNVISESELIEAIKVVEMYRKAQKDGSFEVQDALQKLIDWMSKPAAGLFRHTYPWVKPGQFAENLETDLQTFVLEGGLTSYLQHRHEHLAAGLLPIPLQKYLFGGRYTKFSAFLRKRITAGW